MKYQDEIIIGVIILFILTFLLVPYFKAYADYEGEITVYGDNMPNPIPHGDDYLGTEQVFYNDKVCSENKGMSYTNVDLIIPNWDWLHVDKSDTTIKNGVLYDQHGNILVAMGSYYNKGQVYEITLSNGKSFNVINHDTKANEHTNKNNCYTTSDKTIIEIWVNNDYKYLDIGVSQIMGITVEEIR